MTSSVIYGGTGVGDLSGTLTAVQTAAAADARARGWRPSAAAVVGSLVAVVYTGLALWRYFTMQAGVDLAIYTQAVQGYSNLSAPLSTIKGVQDFNLLGDHFSPVVALLAPIYKAFPHAWVLLIAQSVLVGLTAYLVSRAGSELLGSRAGMTAGLIYGFAWGTQGLALFDFHEVAFALPVLAMVYSRILSGDFAKAALWALPLMVVKEDSIFLVLGVSAVLIAKRQVRLGFSLAAVAVMAFGIIVGWVIPSFSFYGRYTYWSSSAAETGPAGLVSAAGSNLAASVSSGSAVALVAVLLLPTLGVAVRSPLLLGAVPPLLSRLTAPDPVYWSPWFHYNGTLTVVVAFAAIDGIRRLRNRGSRFTVGVWVRGAITLTGLALLLGPGSGVVWSSATACATCNEADREKLQAVPTFARVAAPDSLAAYLVDRTTVYGLHNNLRDSAGIGIQPDYVVLDRSDRLDARLARELRAARFRVVVPIDTIGDTTPSAGVTVYVAG